MTGSIRSRLQWLLPRLGHMTLGWGGVGLIYRLTRHLQGPAMVVIPETALDRAIAFSPDGIWMYLSFFLLIPCAYLFAEKQRLAWLSRAMLACAFLCGVVYLACPTTLNYPPVVGNSPHAAMLRQLVASDSSQNCLPSLHGALTLLAIWALMPRRGVRWTTMDLVRAAFFVTWGVCIAFAVIQTRRHLALDFSAGLLAGWFSGHAVQFLDLRWKPFRLRADPLPSRMPPS